MQKIDKKEEEIILGIEKINTLLNSTKYFLKMQGLDYSLEDTADIVKKTIEFVEEQMQEKIDQSNELFNF